MSLPPFKKIRSARGGRRSCVRDQLFFCSKKAAPKRLKSSRLKNVATSQQKRSYVAMLKHDDMIPFKKKLNGLWKTF